MDAHALWPLSPVAFEAKRDVESSHRTAGPRVDDDAALVDLDGRSVQLPVAGRRVVAAWFLDVRPRRDATVVALGRGAWRHGQPNAGAQARAAALVARGVGVLLVDNCERLVTGVARVAQAILARAPRVTVLATSQIALNLQGEHVYRLDTLDLPAEDTQPSRERLPHAVADGGVLRIDPAGRRACVGTALGWRDAI